MRITLRKLPLALGPLPSPSHGSFQNECPLPIKIPMLGLDLEHFTTAASLGSEEQVLLERSGSQPWSVGMGLAHASGSSYFAVHVSHPSPSPLPTEGHSGCFLFFFFFNLYKQGCNQHLYTCAFSFRGLHAPKEDSWVRRKTSIFHVHR